MVQKGPFSAEIVYADTKIKFQEHTAPNGQIYVEVEPDAEYFIRVQSQNANPVAVSYTVDGTNLGYQTTITQSSFDAGLWSFDGHKDTQKALVFVKTPVRAEGDPSNAPPYWTGEIKVEFFEGVYQGVGQRQVHKSSWAGGDVGYQIGAGDPSKKKGLKSTKGEHFESKAGARTGHKYAKGQLLDTITLKYCSTIGLIHAGILPKPPAWELHRMQYPNPNGPPTEMPGDMNVDLTAE